MNIDLKITNKLISDFMETGIWEYHDDWNLLMSVVDKIDRIETEIKLPKESKGWYAYYSLETCLSMADKPMAVKTMVEFIEWYNDIK